MKTVGDFKKAGLVFVNGDEGSSFFVVNPKAMNERSFNDGDDVESFAWRENTGEKPSFNGLIDVEHRDGDIFVSICINSSDCCDTWAINGDHDGDIIKWRPSLNQPEQNTSNNEAAKPNDKPIFTQEMADAGELPPVGSEVSLRHKFNSKQIHITGKVLYSSREHCIIDGEHKECHYKMCDYNYEPIDTRTPKQKAVDEIQHMVCYQGFLSKQGVSLKIAEMIYDAGYRKSEQSQAKGGKMRTETELKAAALDSFMDAAKAGGGGVRWPEIQTAAIALSAIYAAEKHLDEKSEPYDDKTEYFGEDYKR